MKRHFYYLLALFFFFTLSACGNLIKETESASVFEKVFSLCSDLLGPIIAIIGIWITLPMIRKKLIAEHISEKIKESQIANSEIQNLSQQLIDKYTSLTDNREELKTEDIEHVIDELNSGFSKAQKSSSDVATLIFYLKATLQGVTKHCNMVGNVRLIPNRVFYRFLIDVLNDINYFSTQIVQIPKSSRIKNENLIKRNYRQYFTKSQIKEFKHFKIGVFEGSDSYHYFSFCDKVNRTQNALFMRSAYQIYWDPCAIAKNLFFEKIYAPSIIGKREQDVPMQTSEHVEDNEPQLFYLIGFTLQKNIFPPNPNPKRYVNLIFYYPDNSCLPPTNLSDDQNRKKLADEWIPETGIKIREYNTISQNEKLRTITFQYDRSVLEKYYQLNRIKINKKLRIMKGNSVLSFLNKLHLHIRHNSRSDVQRN